MEKETRVQAAGRPSAELVEQWKAQYGDVYELSPENEDAAKEGVPEVLYFRLPGRPELSRMAKTAMTDSLKAFNNLCMDCVLWPDKSALVAVFDKKPGLMISLGAKVQQLVGAGLDFTHRRL